MEEEPKNEELHSEEVHNEELQNKEEVENEEVHSEEVYNEELHEEPNKEQKKISKKNKKGSYILGTIGAILGGLVATIPWIIIYIYANMIIAVLATIIAGGAYLGYKIFRGKIGKAFPVIITIVSLLIITVVTTVICPTILMVQAGYPMTIDNLLGLYSDVQADVRTAIVEDLIVSLLFTIIGIAALIKNISNQVKNNTKTEETINQNNVNETAEQETTQNPVKTKKKRISLKAIMITIVLIILIVGIGLVTENILSKMERQVTIPNTSLEIRIDGSQQKIYGTTEKIAEEFGSELAQYYDVIIEGTGEKAYLLYGQILNKTKLEGYDATQIIQANRDYDASYYSEEMTSEVLDKKLGDKNIKSYTIKYKNSEEQIYTGIRYLYEGKDQYLWLEAYEIDEENNGIQETDAIIEKLFN